MNKIRIKTSYVYNGKANGKVIYHMADIHFNTNTKDSLFRKILDKIYIGKPDYVIITGDLIDTPEIIKDRIRIKKLVNFLSQMGEMCKVIISIGNHDVFCEDDFKFFKKINEIKNIYVLDNDKYVDDFIYVYGITLPSEYYYNMSNKEDYNVLLRVLKRHNRYISNLPSGVAHIFLCHSPMCLLYKDVRNCLHEFDLLLSGHMHNGMVFHFIEKFGGHWGFVGPSKKLFPRVCRGRITIDNMDLIITGGVTKLSKMSGKLLSSLNFLYDMDINKIVFTNKKGKIYGKN